MRKNKLKVKTSAGKVMPSVSWDSEGILLVEFSKTGCHNRFRGMCADIKEVKATNSKDSAKQGHESSPRPPNSPDLAPADFHLFGHLKNALRRRRFATTAS
jgi:hypothetical protein